MRKREQDKFFNWQQTCEFLNCSKSYFYHLVTTGKLKAFCLGKRKGIRVYKSSCIEFLKIKKL